MEETRVNKIVQKYNAVVSGLQHQVVLLETEVEMLREEAEDAKAAAVAADEGQAAAE